MWSPPTVYVNPRSGPDDPRTGLKGGLYDAGQAISGMELVRQRPSPAATSAPTSMPSTRLTPSRHRPRPSPALPVADRRGPSYGGTNSDLAFTGKYLIGGNYNGINFYDISDPAKIKLVTSLVCPGGQGDVSVYKNLVFMSVEAANGRARLRHPGIPHP